jgi:phosphatidylglycerophosphate synthase
MLALAGANLVSVLLFGALYAVAGAEYLSQAAFLVCLAVLAVLAITLWVRVEGRHRALDPIRRLGRVVAGLVMVAIGTPVLVLMPLFWLDRQLPAEAGFTPLLGPVMALTLIALALTAAVNVIGGAIAAGRGLVGRRPRLRS